jgi:CheY-like chemotaxis protein
MAGPGRVLVVEDEDMIRESLVEFLDEQGYEAVGATDGRDALQKLRASPDRWCVILLDLMMPIMDGEAFRDEQRLDPTLSRIPVGVLSAYRDVAERAAALGVAFHVPKPLKLPVLLNLLRQHCGSVALGGLATPKP